MPRVFLESIFAIGIVAITSLSSLHSVKATEPLKVFILAGQSNMEGKAKVSLLEHQLTESEARPQFQHFQMDGKWVERDDVWIKFLDRCGKLTVGYGSPRRIGPELQFGHSVGNHYDQQVLIIKTAWGGKSLFRDFRPPSSGLPARQTLDNLLERARRKNPDATLAEIKMSFGEYYRKMITEISETLHNLDQCFPDYRGQRAEMSGFIWFQGWNDMINTEYTAEYTQNMANFIRDVRKDLNRPDLPFVIGVLGVGGTQEEKPNPKRTRFKRAQSAVGKIAEFHGNLKVIQTDQFWDTTADAVFKKGWRQHRDEWEKVGSDFPYHYLGSVKTYCQIGAAFADAIIELDGQ